MPVSDVLPLNALVADGLASSFPFPFKIFLEGDLVVLVAGVAAVLGIDYSVTVGEPTGGSVDFLPGKKPTAGQQVDQIRRIPLARQISYTEHGMFHALTVDEDLDRVVMMAQELHLTVEDQGNRVVILEGLVAAAVSNFSTIVLDSGAGPAPSVIDASASLGPVTIDLAGLTDVTVSRADDTGNELKILDSDGATLLREPFLTLDVQDEYVHLRKIGDNWKRI